MARVNIYLPDDLADRAKDAQLNVSALAQAAITQALESAATDSWLEQLPRPARTVGHEDALAALDEARSELGG
jgi:post-segregation antitoxin (ccd killing protein)